MKIVVLLGGDSPERDVSVSSGMGVVRALRECGHEVCSLDPALPLDGQAEPDDVRIAEAPSGQIPVLPPERTFEWVNSPFIRGADVTFVGLHGGSGEDGTIQAILEIAGIPYTGTGVLGSALAMNKGCSKALFRGAGVRTAPSLVLREYDETGPDRVGGLIEREIGYPVVIKPVCQGSSVGFSFVPDRGGLAAGLEKAAAYHGGTMIERFIPGREITAAILDGEPLPLVEVIPEGGFYDYRCKYTKGCSEYVVPARIEPVVTERIQREAVLAYEALMCRDYARADFRLSDDGEPYCLEVNTLPGMTGLSLVPMAASAVGISFGELLERICLMADARREK